VTITNGYGDLEGYKQRFFDGDVNDHEDDVFLEPIVEAVSRLIDNTTGRRFYAATETRYFSPTDALTLFVDDLLTVTTIKTDGDGDRTYENTWDTGDYDLEPLNAATDGAPYTWIEVAVLGSYVFPCFRASVEIAGSWGYCASTNQPTPITEALYLGANRIVHRLSTPLGVSASPSLGQLQVKVSQLTSDPDWMALIDPYTRKV